MRLIQSINQSIEYLDELIKLFTIDQSTRRWKFNLILISKFCLKISRLLPRYSGPFTRLGRWCDTRSQFVKRSGKCPCESSITAAWVTDLDMTSDEEFFVHRWLVGTDATSKLHSAAMSDHFLYQMVREIRFWSMTGHGYYWWGNFFPLLSMLANLLLTGSYVVQGGSPTKKNL